MSLRFSLLLIVALSMVGLPKAQAQVKAQAGAITVPERVQEQLPVSVINTRTFPNQIDTRLTVQPPLPANPSEPPDFVFQSNNLPVGGLLPLDRQRPGSKWPAIGATGWYPPDPDFAVGMNHAVVVVNSSLAFFSKSGTKQFQQTAETFFKGVAGGTFLFDPKCFYDRVHDRFVVLFLEEDDASQTSKLLVAVSDDGDPNGNWYRYRIESKLTISGSSYWLDYPGFGYNKDAYVVSGNMFGFVSGFAGAQVIVIPSAPLLLGKPAAAVSLRDSASASIQMAEVIDPTRKVVFGVSRSSTTELKVFSVLNPGTLTPGLVWSTVTVPSNASPAGASTSTSGRTLDALDGRVFNAVWRGGRLVTGHTTTIGGFNAARWYEINTGRWPDTAGAPVLVQAGNISSPTTHMFTPAININSQGGISVLFTASSSTLTADIRIASRAASDPLGAMSLPTTLESSAGNNYSQGRWGDYFGVDVDPVDDTTFWGVGESVDPTNGWRTSVFNWTLTAPPVAMNTAPTVSITAPINGSIFVSGSPNATPTVSFVGSATDVQDGNLTSSLVWTSSLQGPLGNGGSFSRSDLVEGTHVITASVTDSGGLVASATATITIQALSTPAVPKDLKVVKASAGVARLTWTDDSSNETSFEIERESRLGNKWINTATLTAPANATTINDSPGSGSFRYRVRAVNAMGTSAWTVWIVSPQL